MREQSPPALSITPLEVPPDATVSLPGSKSITNRALICAALAAGETTLTGALFADDTLAMVEAVRSLGAEVICTPEKALMRIRGTAGAVETREGAVVDARMSGTTGRFVAPVLALSERPVTLDGHPQLRARPFGDLADSLRRLGVRVEFPSGGDGLPMLIRGPVRSGDTSVAADRSSQFLSGLMLAAPLVPGGLRIRIAGVVVSRSYVEMTAEVMRAFGAASRSATTRCASRGRATGPRALRGGARCLVGLVLHGGAAVTGGTVRVEDLGSGSAQATPASPRCWRPWGRGWTRTKPAPG